MTPDRVAGWAAGSGIGFAVLIVTWLIFNRLTGLWLPVPIGPIVALLSAIVAGIAVTVERGRTLTRPGSRRAEPEPNDSAAMSRSYASSASCVPMILMPHPTDISTRRATTQWPDPHRSHAGIEFDN